MRVGWEEKTLGEVIKLEYGKPLPKSKRTPSGSYPVYGANGVKTRTNEFYFDKPSIIVGRKGSAGEINFSENKFWPLDVTYFVTFDDKEYDLSYIYYLFANLCLPKLAKGVKPGINRNDVYSICVQIPSLPEQQRIVEILDGAFSAIATAKASVEKNLANARELFESYLQSVFANPGEDWEERELREVTTKIGSGATPRGGKKSYKSEGISLIRSMNVHDLGFRAKNLAFIDTKQAEKLANVNVESGDVLLNITGASVTRCCIVPNDVLPARVNQHVSIIRVERAKLLPAFLHYNFISKEYKEMLLKIGDKGATRQAITKAEIEKIFVKYPSITKQSEIVAHLDSLFIKTKKLEAIYQQKFTNLTELKQSLLQKAFKGELTREFI